MKYFTAKGTRHLSKDRVRKMCMFNRFYTCGDNEEYHKMLSYVEQHAPTLQNLILVAQDIYEHSNVEHLMEKYNEDEKTIFGNILFNLEDCVVSTFEVSETPIPTWSIQTARPHEEA